MNDASSGPFWAIQVVESVNSESEAAQILASLREQAGCIGGRINPPPALGWWEVAPIVPADPVWQVQAIFETNGDAPNGWLPDGMRHVLILDSQRRSLGIAEVA